MRDGATDTFEYRRLFPAVLYWVNEAIVRVGRLPMIRLWLATGVALVIGVSAHGQGGGSGGGSGGSSGGSSFSGGGLSGGGSGLTGGGNSFSGNNSFSGGGNITGSGSNRTGVGGRSSSSSAVSSTNFLAASYGNPLYPGRPGSTNLNISAGGGFGQATLPNTNTGRGTTGGAGNRLGGTASVGGAGLNGSGAQTSISRIQHTTTLDFPVRAVVTQELQDELRGMVARSSSLKAPERITVSVEGNTVVLSGVVSDDKEKRLVEGMVRLTPGVQAVRNELQTP